ncbi:MAG: hypothetical protein H6825_14145, partial [Planctomycetes bacterium]|nr:hypothetical protein [Planctomycetota bacterium]
MGRVDWVWATPPAAALRTLGDDFAAGRLPPDEVLLKHSRARSVWSAPDSCGGLLLKHYRVRGLEPWKALVQPGRAEREYRVMEAFCRLGVPTVRPIGYAERRDGVRLREAWFLGRLVPDASSLSEAITDPARDDAARGALVEQAIDLVVALHAHPFLHRDLHAGNLLLTQEGRLLVIDLHSVWRVPRLTRAMRLANLAELVFSLREGLSLDAAGEWFGRYAVARGEPLDVVVRLGREALRRFERDYVRGRAARCLRDSSEFVGERVAEGRVHRRREYTLDALRADLAQHAALFGDVPHAGIAQDEGARPSVGAVLGDAARAHVSRVGGCDETHVVKAYRDRGPVSALRARLGRGRARGAWKAARRLAVEGVPTPEALALLERPDG